MYHIIKFTANRWVDLEKSPRHRLERLLLRAGDELSVQIKPYVVQTVGGPVETADLFFADGTAVREVPFACFSFIE